MGPFGGASRARGAAALNRNQPHHAAPPSWRPDRAAGAVATDPVRRQISKSWMPSSAPATPALAAALDQDAVRQAHPRSAYRQRYFPANTDSSAAPSGAEARRPL